MMNTRVCRRICAVIVLAGLLLCGGCGQENHASPDTGGAKLTSSLSEYARQLLDADNGSMDAQQKNILRSVIKHGKVSVSDYEAAWQRYSSCVTDKGYNKPQMIRYPNGLQHPDSDDASPELATDLNAVEKQARDLDACDTAHVEAVQKLYMLQVGNPSLYKDQDEGALDCLKRHNLVSTSYTLEQYKKDSGAWAHGSDDLGFDPNNAEVRGCLAANGHLFVSAGNE